VRYRGLTRRLAGNGTSPSSSALRRSGVQAEPQACQWNHDGRAAEVCRDRVPEAPDNGGTTSGGGSTSDLFADDAHVYFPKWGWA
jgi:hypothetical protein